MKYEFYSGSLGMAFSNTRPASPMDRTNDGYDQLLKDIRRSFEEAVANHDILFTTNCEDLYDKFLNHLPLEARQHYNCTACRNFVNRYGGLVTIDSHGVLHPVMWKYTPHSTTFFDGAVARMRITVSAAKVNGVFVTSEKRLGMPKTGVWTHMSVDTPKWMVYKSYLKTAGQEAAEKKEEFRMLMEAIDKYDIHTVETAVNFLRSDSMYRGDKFLGIAEWFLELLKNLNGVRGYQYSNLVWMAAAKAPNGFCHISSSMIGTLLDDIQDNLDFDSIKRRFNEKMNPLKYQRPQVAPSTGNVKRAEEIVAKLGLENSLKRRFARLDEIKTVWTPQQTKSSTTYTGVFSGLKTKNEPIKNTYNTDLPATTMTWEKFNRTVLPTAKKIEMHIGYDREPFTAIVGPENMDANPIILWDKEEQRNPYSWYLYHGGSHARDWNLSGGRYVDVTGITLQPNLWQDGLMWNCSLRVTTDVGVRKYKLDRWD